MRFGRSFNMTKTIAIDINGNTGLAPLQINKSLVLELSSSPTPAGSALAPPQPTNTEVPGGPGFEEIGNAGGSTDPVATIHGSGPPPQINTALIEELSSQIQLKSLNNTVINNDTVINQATDGFNFSQLDDVIIIGAVDPNANLAEASVSLVASGQGRSSISVSAVSYAGADGAFAAVVAVTEGDVVSGSAAVTVTGQDWIF